RSNSPMASGDTETGALMSFGLLRTGKSFTRSSGLRLDRLATGSLLQQTYSLGTWKPADSSRWRLLRDHLMKLRQGKLQSLSFCVRISAHHDSGRVDGLSVNSGLSGRSGLRA